jgi:hypothetical protein
MTYWLFPEAHLAANVRVPTEFDETVVQRADGFIAIWESTRNDAVYHPRNRCRSRGATA